MPTVVAEEDPALLALAPKSEEAETTSSSGEPKPGSLYTLNTPMSYQEAIEGFFRAAYVTQVKDTDAPLEPVLIATMDKLEQILMPALGPFKEVQAHAQHRVTRNREIAAGGLTDEQQALVLELHSLVDEDGNGTVEKEELETAVGDKRGKMFEKLVSSISDMNVISLSELCFCVKSCKLSWCFRMWIIMGM